MVGHKQVQRRLHGGAGCVVAHRGQAGNRQAVALRSAAVSRVGGQNLRLACRRVADLPAHQLGARQAGEALVGDAQTGGVGLASAQALAILTHITIVAARPAGATATVVAAHRAIGAGRHAHGRHAYAQGVAALLGAKAVYEDPVGGAGHQRQGQRLCTVEEVLLRQAPVALGHARVANAEQARRPHRVIQQRELVVAALKRREVIDHVAAAVARAHVVVVGEARVVLRVRVGQRAHHFEIRRADGCAYAAQLVVRAGLAGRAARPARATAAVVAAHRAIGARRHTNRGAGHAQREVALLVAKAVHKDPVRLSGHQRQRERRAVVEVVLLGQAAVPLGRARVANAQQARCPHRVIQQRELVVAVLDRRERVGHIAARIGRARVARVGEGTAVLGVGVRQPRHYEVGLTRGRIQAAQLVVSTRLPVGAARPAGAAAAVIAAHRAVSAGRLTHTRRGDGQGELALLVAKAVHVHPIGRVGRQRERQRARVIEEVLTRQAGVAFGRTHIGNAQVAGRAVGKVWEVEVVGAIGGGGERPDHVAARAGLAEVPRVVERRVVGRVAVGNSVHHEVGLTGGPLQAAQLVVGAGLSVGAARPAGAAAAVVATHRAVSAGRLAGNGRGDGQRELALLVGEAVHVHPIRGVGRERDGERTGVVEKVLARQAGVAVGRTYTGDAQVAGGAVGEVREVKVVGAVCGGGERPGHVAARAVLAEVARVVVGRVIDRAAVRNGVNNEVSAALGRGALARRAVGNARLTRRTTRVAGAATAVRAAHFPRAVRGAPFAGRPVGRAGLALNATGAALAAAPIGSAHLTLAGGLAAAGGGNHDAETGVGRTDRLDRKEQRHALAGRQGELRGAVDTGSALQAGRAAAVAQGDQVVTARLGGCRPGHGNAHVGRAAGHELVFAFGPIPQLVVAAAVVVVERARRGRGRVQGRTLQQRGAHGASIHRGARAINTHVTGRAVRGSHTVRSLAVDRCGAITLVGPGVAGRNAIEVLHIGQSAGGFGVGLSAAGAAVRTPQSQNRTNTQHRKTQLRSTTRHNGSSLHHADPHGR